ncbi:hypothetical protein NDU88_000277 [Pleurodeles waltl]|uniref:Uncharacterized protein n=1 Tax=Pleurodeles waltl TaxID=8319 RepID=A0AAV7P588_PLEWA|nr:hypothetical protein NDU88_000277 [Pleurodeles waltl]
MDVPIQGPTAAEPRAEIQGCHIALEGKMDTVAMEINHLGLDLQKVADRTTAVDNNVDYLKKYVQSLRAEVEGLKCSTTHTEERLEDAAGRLQRLVGFPEGRPLGLSFVWERLLLAHIYHQHYC